MRYIPFQPESTADYHLFTANWCDRCTKHRAPRSCPIIGASIAVSVDDPAYPRELRFDDDAQPMCTAFEAAFEAEDQGMQRRSVS